MPLKEYEQIVSRQGEEPIAPEILERTRLREVQLRRSVSLAADRTPDRHAEVLRLSERTGLAPELVERNFDKVRGRAIAADPSYAKMLRETPAVAEYLSNPDNAAVSKDDHEQLGTIERLLDVGRNLTGALAAGLPGAAAGFLQTLRGIGENASPLVSREPGVDIIAGAEVPRYRANPQPNISRRDAGSLARLAKTYENAAARFRGGQKNAGPMERAIYGGVESVSQNLLMLFLAAPLGPGAEAAALGGMGVVSAGQSYGQAREQGVQPGAAAGFAAFQGAIEVLTEKIPVGTLFKELGLKSGLGRLLVRELAAEIPGEQVATALQDLAEWAALPEHNGETLGDYLRARPGAAADTLVSTIVGTVGQAGVMHAAVHAGGKPVQQQYLEELGKAVHDSKTFHLLPEKLQQLVLSMTKDGLIENAYLPIDDVRTYAQSINHDPGDFMEAATPGGRGKFEQAATGNTDVQIPFADYVAKIAPGAAAAHFNEAVRLGDPEAMNVREAREFEKQQKERFTREPLAEPELDQSAAKVREDIIGQMTGTVMPKALDAYARTYEQGFRAMGKRVGMDPFSLYERYRLQITRPLAEVLRTLPGADTRLDPLIDRLRSGKFVTPEEMFGTPLLDFIRQNGGVKDEGGELASFDIDADRKPFQRRIINNKTGLPLDTAREAAAEAGYLDRQSSISDFLDVIDKEARGAPVYAQGQNPQAIEQSIVLEQLGAYLKSRDIDVQNATNTEIKKVLREVANETEARNIDARTGMVLDQTAYRPIESELQTAFPIPDTVPVVDISSKESFAGMKGGDLRQRAAGAIGDLAHRQVTNAHTGWTVELSKEGLKKSARLADRPERLVAFEGLPGLIADATYLRSGPDRANPRGVPYDYLYAPFTSDGQIHVAKITLRKGQRGADRTFYSLHAVEVEEPGRLSSKFNSEAAAEPLGGRPGLSTADLYAFVNGARRTTRLFQDSTQLNLDKRGDIVFGKDPDRPGERRFSIRLLEGMDTSTFLHETGHFFLEVFGDVVDELRTLPGELNETQQRMVADYDKMLKKLGVESRDQIGRDQHEYFARSFEAYLREGKAPSPELRSVFRRYKDWLTRIYKSLKHLQVKLDPELNEIFDRLLATDEQIERARKDAAITAMIESRETAERLGMTPEQHRLYGEKVRDAGDREKEALFFDYMDEYGERQSAWYAARRTEVRAEAAGEVHGQRDYIALSFLKDGTLPDGSPLPEGIVAAKLDASALEERYKGKAVRKDLRTAENPGSSVLNELLDRRLYARKGGMDPDQVADIFGYSSGDEMIQAILKTRPMDELIDAETDDRMRQTYGDIKTDGTAAEKARDAVMTEGRSEVIEREMQALARAVRQAAPFAASGERQARQADRAARAAGLDDIRRFVPSVALARDIAGRRIAEMRVRDVKGGLYYAAARRESNAAIAAVNRGDFQTALTHKQQELINVEMYRAATEMAKEVQKTRDYMLSFDKASKRERIGKAGEVYLDQIDKLRERFEFSRQTDKALDKRASLLDFMKSEIAKGHELEIPLELQDEAWTQNYRDMTVSELRGLKDAVQSIEHWANFKNKLLKSQAKRELDAAAGEMAASISGNSKGLRPLVLEDEAAGESSKRGLAGFFAWQRKIASWARQMDGGKDGGAVWEYLIRPINAAADAETVMKEAAAKRVTEIFKMYSRQELAEMSRKEFIPAINQSLSREARIMAALYYGNAEGRQRLQGGLGWDSAKVAAILDTLENKDWQFVQSIWKEVNSYWGEISGKQQRVTGVRPEKVEALSYQTRFGEMPGGYIPLKYSVTDPKSQAYTAKEAAEQMMRGAFTRATTRRGFTEARQDTVNRRLRLSMNVIWEHTSEVIHDLTHHEMLIDVNRLLAHKDVQSSIVNHYGDIVYKNIRDAVSDIAAGHVPIQQQGERALEWLRTGTSIARMGWNTTTALMQPLGLTVSMVRVGPKWVARGMAHWLGDAVRMESSANWIQEKSAFMRERHLTMTREIQDIRDKVHPRGSLVAASVGRLAGPAGARTALEIGRAYGAIEDTYFYFISKAQAIADIPTWLGAYEKAQADHKNDEARAIALADQAVVDSQGSGHIKDLAKAQRGTPTLKIFTQFMTYFSVLYNQGAEAVGRTRLRDPASVMRLGGDLLMLYTVPMFLELVLRDALRGGGDDDDETFAARLAKEQASYLLNTVIFARELSGAVQGFDYKGSGGEGFFAEASHLIKQAEQAELDEALGKAVIQTGGILFHFPATFVQRAVDAYIAAEEQGAGAGLRVLIAGKPRK